jgi:phosphoribosylamine--glycine ligase
MRVLVVGSGGREHALAWKLRQSPNVSELFLAPGNGGTARIAHNIPVKADDIPGLVRAAREHRADLVVVGPEAPLAAGLVDALAEEGIVAFGPTRAAARLESSKAFAKDFMARHSIPTAPYRVFADYEQACSYVLSLTQPPVVKADGLAAGKGAIVPGSIQEALEAVRRLMVEQELGTAGTTLVLEERLQGQEVSLLALCDGSTLAPLLPAQDHKAVFDNDEGPNTGGMGAYAPAPAMTAAVQDRAVREILEPTVRGMGLEGTPYRGVLYAGLMLTEDGPQVLEFNCRFGDPETQALLPLLEADLALLLWQCACGQLDVGAVRWRAGFCVCVVMASGGYPGQYRTGLPIYGVEAAEALGCIVFHAGTRWSSGQLVTSGGRVLGVTAVGQTLKEAIDRAYAGVRAISFEGAHFRTDIGAKGLQLCRQLASERRCT